MTRFGIIRFGIRLSLRGMGSRLSIMAGAGTDGVGILISHRIGAAALPQLSRSEHAAWELVARASQAEREMQSFPQQLVMALQAKVARFHRLIVDNVEAQLTPCPPMPVDAVPQAEPLNENQMQSQRKLTRLLLEGNQAESVARRHILHRRNAVRCPLLHRLVVAVLLARPLLAHQGDDNDNLNSS